MKKIMMILIVLSSSVFAWDGERAGFLLGTGFGINTLGSVDLDAASDAPEGSVIGTVQYITSETGKIGYAWDNQNAVILNTVGFSTNLSYGGFNYLSWSEPEVQSNMWYGGAGYMMMTNNDLIYNSKAPDEDSKFGFGVNFGYGYQFVEHMTFDMNLTIGAVDDLLVIGTMVSISILGY